MGVRTRTLVMAGRFVATGVLLVSAAALQARPPTSCNLSKDATGLSVLGPRPRPTPLPRPRSPIIVTNTNDSGAGSLRQALADAQDGDIISFAPALLGQTVTLTSAEIVIGKNITIRGPASGRLAISRSLSSPPFRIFHVMPYWSVAIQGLTITGGTVELDESGAGILNDHATLTVSNCTIEFNGSAECGGGICNDGSDGSATLSIVDSTISSNFSSGEGGGICNNGPKRKRDIKCRK